MVIGSTLQLTDQKACGVVRQSLPQAQRSRRLHLDVVHPALLVAGQDIVQPLETKKPFSAQVTLVRLVKPRQLRHRGSPTRRHVVTSSR